jgi:CBS domain-containing protein
MALKEPTRTEMEEPKEPPHKKQRTGVGSSVATLVHSDTDDLVLVLSKIKVERLLPRGHEVITTETTEKLPGVFKKMVDANVTSLPVINQKGKYSGVVEILDLVEFVTRLFSDLGSTQFVDMEKVLVSENKFTQATVSNLTKPAKKHKLHRQIDKGYSLFAAWELLALGGVYRVPILDENGKICDLITQSMLIDFLWQNIEKIGALANEKIQDMKSQTEMLSFVPSTSKAIFAFREMVKTETRGLAVLDDSGKLVDNISLKDLRGIHTDATVFWRLWSTVSEFKNKVKEEFPDKTPMELVYALPTDTLYSVVEKMAKMHIHRIYVVENAESLKPHRVITQTDILREVLCTK